MLYSMTGYGRATRTLGSKTITAELRALNSKSTDIKLRFPGDIKSKEPFLRKYIQEKAVRGKIDLLLDIQSPDSVANISLNTGLFKGYYFALQKMSNELGIEQNDMLQTIVRIPNVITPPTSTLDEAEWEVILETVKEAIANLMAFRREEGIATAEDLSTRVHVIMELLEQVKPFEVERKDKMRNRLLNNMEDVIGKDKLDSNRFEQEVMYYLERMDFSEEQMRLHQHCVYFLEQLDDEKTANGRTLNFIGQEMGREINTLGAKAYNSDIQRIVVKMKDELEKVKEQLANIL